MTRFLAKLFGTTAPRTAGPAAETRLGLETLELREVPSVSGAIASVRTAQGYTEVFEVAGNGTIYEETQNSFNVRTGYYPWRAIGGNAKAVAAIRDGADVELFAITTDGRVWEQTEASGERGYSDARWTLLANPNAAPAKSIALGRDSGDNLRVYCETTLGTVWEMTENPLGGYPKSSWYRIDCQAAAIDATTNSRGEPELFVMRPNGEIDALVGGQVEGAWWVPDKSVVVGYGATSIAVSGSPLGPSELFAVTTDGRIWEQTEAALPWWDNNPSDTGWRTSNWSVVGGGARSIAVGLNANNTVELFAVTTDGRIWEQTEAANTGGYSTGRWSVIGSGGGQLAVARDADYNAVVINYGTNGHISEQTEAAHAGGFSTARWGIAL